MLFEFRHYKLQDDKRDDWVTFMESTIIPFQQSQGMVVLGSFIDEEDPNSYHWIRRFRDESEREAQYAAVYESDTWKNEIASKIPEMIDKVVVVRRLIPTEHSGLQ